MAKTNAKNQDTETPSISEAIVAPPGRARFVPIGTQDEQVEEDRLTRRPRKDSTGDE